jgi:hypothetical protein
MPRARPAPTAATKLPAPPERDVLRACCAVLTAFGVFWWRQNTGGLYNASGQYVAFGEPGASDLAGVLPGTGRFLAVECKRSGKRPTPEQIDYLNRVNEAGGCGLWTDDARHLFAALPFLLEGWAVRLTEDSFEVYAP